MSFSAQIEKIRRGKSWRFFGGIKPEGRKNTTDIPIKETAVPGLITLPADRHLGQGGSILVSVGDKVKAGQKLTEPGGKRNVPLHASTSGEITGIGKKVLPHPSGFSGLCISIKPDGLDESVEPQPMKDWESRTTAELLHRIRDFGVEGLGGAQFQTAAKLESALEESADNCNVFIVNGAECEPVATCDDRLMQEKAEEIAQGIEVIRKILNPKVIIVAIEDNKKKAAEAMKKAVAKDVIVKIIPSIYPSGAARNLIKICTGIEIPYSAHTSECGIVVDNVETVFAVKQAVIDGIPLIKRVMTIDGQSLGITGNYLVRLGTSVRFLLQAAKLKPEFNQRIIMGGPFMGFTLPTIDVPVTKSTTCIFAPTEAEMPKNPESTNCIRCGRCARVCPSRLVPYMLYALSRAGDHKKTEKCGMNDCTECGCCSFVCPSKIALTGQFRKEKAILRLLSEKKIKAVQAKERTQQRNERLQKEAEARAEKVKAAKRRAELMRKPESELTDAEREEKKNLSIAAARERAKARKEMALNRAALAGRASKNAEKAQEEIKEPALPSSLKKMGEERHAAPIQHYPAQPEVKPDLSIVENPPQEGTVFDSPAPVNKRFLNTGAYADPDYIKTVAVPKRLRRADLPEKAEAAESGNKDETKDLKAESRLTSIEPSAGAAMQEASPEPQSKESIERELTRKILYRTVLPGLDSAKKAQPATESVTKQEPQLSDKEAAEREMTQRILYSKDLPGMKKERVVTAPVQEKDKDRTESEKDVAERELTRKILYRTELPGLTQKKERAKTGAEDTGQQEGKSAGSNRWIAP